MREMAMTTCRLTTKDFAILETLLERKRALGDPLAAVLEKKLANASVVLIGSVDPDVVTINSRVTFRVDGKAAETRTVIQNEARGVVGGSLSMTTPWGLSLLGMTEGETTLVERAEGETEQIRVVKVLFQPEAALRASVARPSRPRLRLVYSANSVVPPLGAVAEMRQTEGKDDPDGPTAA
jgi:regulator of nucleoside diphosphate kinase